MKNTRRLLSGFAGVLVALALVGVTRAEAQSAAQFVGKWTITFPPPGGGAGGPPPGAGPAGGAPGGGGGGFRRAPTVIDVTQTDGTLAATMTGGFGMGGQGAEAEPRPISDVKVVEGALVLTYTVSFGPDGNSFPVTLTLTPDGDATKAAMDMGNGRVREGTAVKS